MPSDSKEIKLVQMGARFYKDFIRLKLFERTLRKNGSWNDGIAAVAPLLLVGMPEWPRDSQLRLTDFMGDVAQTYEYGDRNASTVYEIGRFHQPATRQVDYHSVRQTANGARDIVEVPHDGDRFFASVLAALGEDRHRRLGLPATDKATQISYLRGMLADHLIEHGADYAAAFAADEISPKEESSAESGIDVSGAFFVEEASRSKNIFDLIDRYEFIAVPLILEKISSTPPEQDAPHALDEDAVRRIEAVAAVREDFVGESDPVPAMLAERLKSRLADQSFDAVYDELTSSRTREALEQYRELRGEDENDEWAPEGHRFFQLAQQQLQDWKLPAIKPLRVRNAVEGAVAGFYALNATGFSPATVSLHAPPEHGMGQKNAETQDPSQPSDETTEQSESRFDGQRTRTSTLSAALQRGDGLNWHGPQDTRSMAEDAASSDRQTDRPRETRNHVGSRSALHGSFPMFAGADVIEPLLMDEGATEARQMVSTNVIVGVSGLAYKFIRSAGARNAGKWMGLPILIGAGWYLAERAAEYLRPTPPIEQGDTPPADAITATDDAIASLELTAPVRDFVRALNHAPAGDAHSNRTAWQMVLDLVREKGDGAVDDVKAMLEQPRLTAILEHFEEAEARSAKRTELADDNHTQEGALHDHRFKMRQLASGADSQSEAQALRREKRSREHARSTGGRLTQDMAPGSDAENRRQLNVPVPKQEIDQALDQQICTWAVDRDFTWKRADIRDLWTDGFDDKYVLYNGRWYLCDVGDQDSVTIREPKGPNFISLVRRSNGWTAEQRSLRAEQGPFPAGAGNRQPNDDDAPAYIAAWKVVRTANAALRQHPNELADYFQLLEIMDRKDGNVTVADEMFAPSMVSTYGRALEAAQETLRQLQSSQDFAPLLDDLWLCDSTPEGAPEQTTGRYLRGTLAVKNRSLLAVFESHGRQYWRTLDSGGSGAPGMLVPATLRPNLSKLYDQVDAVGGELDLRLLIPLNRVLAYYQIPHQSEMSAGELAKLCNQRIETYTFGEKDDPLDIEALAGEYVDLRNEVAQYVAGYLNRTGSTNLAQALIPPELPGFATVQRMHARPEAAFASLMERAAVNTFITGLLRELEWYGGAAHELTAPKVRAALLQMALTESLAPSEQRTPFQVAGFGLEKGEFYSKIREDFEAYLSGELGVSRTQAGLVAHCLWTEVAPEFLVRDVPGDLRFGSSVGWADFSYGVELQEWLKAGSSREASFSKLIALPGSLNANATDKQFAVFSSMQSPMAAVLYSSPAEYAANKFNASEAVDRLVENREKKRWAVDVALNSTDYPRRVESIEAKLTILGFDPDMKLKPKAFNYTSRWGVSERHLGKVLNEDHCTLKNVVASGRRLDSWAPMWTSTHQSAGKKVAVWKTQSNGVLETGTPIELLEVKPDYDKELSRFIEAQRDAYAILIEDVVCSLPQNQVDCIKNGDLRLYPIANARTDPDAVSPYHDPGSHAFLPGDVRRLQGKTSVGGLGFVMLARHEGAELAYEVLPYPGVIRRRQDVEVMLDNATDRFKSRYGIPAFDDVSRTNELKFNFTDYNGGVSDGENLGNKTGYLMITKPIFIGPADGGAGQISRLSDAAKMHFGVGGGDGMEIAAYGKTPLDAGPETDYSGLLSFASNLLSALEAGPRGSRKPAQSSSRNTHKSLMSGHRKIGKVALSKIGALKRFGAAFKSFKPDSKMMSAFSGELASSRLDKRRAAGVATVDPSTWRAGSPLMTVDDLDNVPVYRAESSGRPKYYLVNPRTGNPVGPMLAEEDGNFYTAGTLRSRFISKNSEPMYTLGDLNVRPSCTRTKRAVQAACFPGGMIATVARDPESPGGSRVHNGILWTAGEWRPDIRKRLVVFEGRRVSTTDMTPVRDVKPTLADKASVKIVQGRFGGSESGSPFCIGEVEGAYKGIKDTFTGGVLVGKHVTSDGKPLNLILMRRGPNEYLIGTASGELTPGTLIEARGISLKKARNTVEKALEKAGIAGMGYDRFYQFAQAYEGAVDFGLYCRWLDQHGIQQLGHQYGKIDRLIKGHGISAEDFKNFDPFNLGSTLTESVFFNKSIRREFNVMLVRKIASKQGRSWSVVDEQGGNNIKDVLMDVYRNDPDKLHAIRSTRGADIKDISSIGILQKNDAGAEKNFASLQVRTADGTEYVFVAISGGVRGKFSTLESPPKQWARTVVEGVPAVRTNKNRVFIECPVNTLTGPQIVESIDKGPPNSAVPSGVGEGRYKLRRTGDADLTGSYLGVAGNFRLVDAERMQAETFDRVVKDGAISGSPIVSGFWYSSRPVCDSCVLAIATVESKFPNTAPLKIMEGRSRGPADTQLIVSTPPAAPPSEAHRHVRTRREIFDLAFGRGQHQEARLPVQKQPDRDLALER